MRKSFKNPLLAALILSVGFSCAPVYAQDARSDGWFDKVKSYFKRSNKGPVEIKMSQGTLKNEPDYALAIFPLLNWKYPDPDQDGWASYYTRIGFLLGGDRVHLISDVVTLPQDLFKSVDSGKSEDLRPALFADALNYLFSDEGTTGAAIHLQNGLTDIHVGADGRLNVNRGSMCKYDLALSEFSFDRYGVVGRYTPQTPIAPICGSVPVGLEVQIVSAPKEELLQRLYCDDHPDPAQCAPDSSIWTVPDFRRV